MGFYEVFANVTDILQREDCTSYRALKRQPLCHRRVPQLRGVFTDAGAFSGPGGDAA
jgi:hypothetical protein